MTRFHEQMKQAREEDEVEEMDINTRMGLMMIAKSIVDERAQLRQNKEEDHCECGDKVVDYGDKLCHKCYHKSCEDEGEKCYCGEEEICPVCGGEWTSATRCECINEEEECDDCEGKCRANETEECEKCGDKVVDYGDKLCHKCYHKSCEDEGEKCYCEEEEEEEMDYWVANGGTIEFITCILQEVMDGGHEEWGSLCDFVDRRK